MRIQPEYMSFKNRCTISSSYEFQAHQQRSQMLFFPECSTVIRGAPRRTQVCRWRSKVLCESNGNRLILRQRVRGSVRAVRAVRNTRVFQTETRVVADEVIFASVSGCYLAAIMILDYGYKMHIYP